MMKKRKLHYLSYYLPPMHSIASVRNHHLLDGLSGYFDETVAYTTANNRLFAGDSSLEVRVPVIRIATLDYRTLVHKLGKSKSQDIHLAEEKKQHPFIKALIKLNETLPFNLFLGEGGLIFIIGAIYRILKNADREHQHVLITSFRPTADIVSGFIVKSWQPDIKWIVSMHDLPYIRRKPNVFFKSLQNWFWKRFLQKADAVITVSEGLSHSLSEYGIKPVTLVNGVDIRKPESAQNDCFTIAFTGSIHKGLMDPSLLFSMIYELINNGSIEAEKINIVYAGKDSNLWKEAAEKWPVIQSRMEINGMVSVAQARQIQEQSNINYLMTWNDDQVKGILTGKFFDYLGARNPIMVLVNGSYDHEFEDIFKECGCGAVFYTQDSDYSDGMRRYIMDKYQVWKQGSYEQTYTDVSNLSDWSWEQRIKTFNDILK